jgi:peptidoglycan/xylan/chitin deacetylase (PgdA/CDA1 family)
MLTIVMYHYVRDLKQSRFPRIRGLQLRDFRGQLDYLQHRHTVVTMEEVIHAAGGSPEDLPGDAALLTFDDGLADHYTAVLPLLDERSWQGTFFVPSWPVLHHRVLDVHKVHFILAAAEDAGQLVRELLELLEEYRDQYELLSAEMYWNQLAQANRFDPPEVIFFKRMLQCELPLPVREDIVDRLFRRHVSADEAAFSNELYMSIDQLRIMQRLGMHIGAHGQTHCWLDRAGPDERQVEIRSSLELLAHVGADIEAWTISYPYGAHDASLRELVRAAGAKIGVSTEVDRADLRRHDPLALPRLDTNDLPRQHSTVRVPMLVGAAV